MLRHDSASAKLTTNFFSSVRINECRLLLTVAQFFLFLTVKKIHVESIYGYQRKLWMHGCINRDIYSINELLSKTN